MTPSTPPDSTIVDLSTPTPTPEGTLQGLPRRVALTLPELQVLAERAHGAPLPFDIAETPAPSTLEDRLGTANHVGEAQARQDALDSLHEPVDSLTRRGLLDDAGPDAGIVGALGLLATPRFAVDIDVAAAGVRAKAWHRQAGQAVATLATTDGIVFELAWFEVAQWPAELARVAVVPEDVELTGSGAGEVIDLPFELLNACGEAIADERADLLPLIVAGHSGAVTRSDIGGRPQQVDSANVLGLVMAIHGEAGGRLRAMVADIKSSEMPLVGVVSWVLLGDGWRSLRTHTTTEGERRIEVRRVSPKQLATELAPVLAEVTQ